MTRPSLKNTQDLYAHKKQKQANQYLIQAAETGNTESVEDVLNK